MSTLNGWILADDLRGYWAEEPYKHARFGPFATPQELRHWCRTNQAPHTETAQKRRHDRAASTFLLAVD